MRKVQFNLFLLTAHEDFLSIVTKISNMFDIWFIFHEWQKRRKCRSKLSRITSARCKIASVRRALLKFAIARFTGCYTGLRKFYDLLKISKDPIVRSPKRFGLWSDCLYAFLRVFRCFFEACLWRFLDQSSGAISSSSVRVSHIHRKPKQFIY